MSGKLLKLKDKILITKKTKKITKAMELVASSKVRFFQNKSEGLEKFAIEYHQKLKTINVSIAKPELDEQDYNPIFILYTSDKGLCGGMNNKIIKTLSDSKEWQDSKSKNVIVIGKKGVDYAKRRKLNILESFDNLVEKPDQLDILDLVDKILEHWKTNEYTHIYMVIPQFSSRSVFYPVVKQLLPLETTNNEEIQEFTFEFEPSEEQVSEVATDILIHSLIYSGFYSLKAAEYLSRMIAMQNATKSANEIIDNLTIDYNSERQAVITQQIIEVINGS